MNPFFTKQNLEYSIQVVEISNKYQNSRNEFLTEKEELYYEKIKAESRKNEWLTTRFLVKKLFGKQTEISYKQSGQPYISTNAYNIGITHSKSIAGIVLSKNKKVAIDCELIGDKALRLLPRFAHKYEIEKVPAGFEKEYATILWSAKEAIYKYFSNINFTFDKDICCVFEDPTAESGTITASVMLNESFHYYKLEYTIYKGYSIVWIVDNT